MRFRFSIKSPVKTSANIVLILFIVFAEAIGEKIGKVRLNSFYKGIKFGETNQILVKVSEEINKRLPMTINQFTRLDSTFAGPGPIFTYNYTLTQHASPDIASNEILNKAKQLMYNDICTNKHLAIFNKLETKLIYKYNDKNNRFIGEIDVDPALCN